MQKKSVYCLLLTLLALIIIGIISFVIITVTQTKVLSDYIETNNISKITISTSIPEEFNKNYEFELSETETQEFIGLIDNASVKRKLFKEDVDSTGYTMIIEYLDGNKTTFFYNQYILLNDKWYSLDENIFEYIYKTDSYKAAKSLNT